MVLQPVKCPLCGGIDVVKHGKTANDKQRFICQATTCQGQTLFWTIPIRDVCLK
jgi:transposase-like protein